MLSFVHVLRVATPLNASLVALCIEFIKTWKGEMLSLSSSIAIPFWSRYIVLFYLT